MGNTNIPQAGAENVENGRDTRSGDAQLSDDEKRQRDANDKPTPAGPAPSRPKNAPERIPGQNIDVDPNAPPAENPQLAPDDPYNPRNTTGAGDPPSRSHVPSGYSAPDAT
jgi:hypothetical protein